jgi:3-phosphoshikimate 1-carboxyvinyltransferase
MRALGAIATWEEAANGWNLRVMGVAGHPTPPADGLIHVGNAGAVARLLLGVCAYLPEVRFETDHPESLGKRPNADLLVTLRELGLSVEARDPGGLLPISLRGGPPRGGRVHVSGAQSSQYLSALLYLAPLLPKGLDITVTGGLRSAPLIGATLHALTDAGVDVKANSQLTNFKVAGGQRFRAREHVIPGDAPSAAALVAAAAALGVPLRLERLAWDEADVRALVVALDRLGVEMTEQPSADNGGALAITGALHTAPPAQPRLIDCDPIIDSVPVLVALACFTPGETRFVNGANLRVKESDRISDLCAELARAGANVTPEADGITALGKPIGIVGGAMVATHEDHRVAQALAILGLRTDSPLTITGAQVVAKSYPWFYEDLRRLGANVTDS